jgi:DNA-binding NarL/FixJ family response regulator
VEIDVSRAVTADQRPLCRAGLANLLKHSLGISEVIQASDFTHSLAALGRSSNLSLITVGPDLPGMRGVAGLRQLRTDYPALRVVVVAESRDRELVLEALCAGVHGYILKDTHPDEMVRAFEMVLAGRIYVPSLISDIHPRRSVAVDAAPVGEASLTERQTEVLQLIAAGRSNKEIARTLEIAEGTVKVHITAAFRALGVHNRVSAAAALQVRPHNDIIFQSISPSIFAN